MTKSIAIIDDDDAVRDSLSSLLVSSGYLASTYANALEFLNANQKKSPDVIILDHQMDGMTGVDLAEHLTHKKSTIAILMISGNLTETARVRAEAAGVRAILDKPFTDEKLLNAVEKLFEK